MIWHGHDFKTPLPAEGYPKRTRTNGIWKRQEKFYIRRDLAERHIPAIGTVDAENFVVGTVEVVEQLHGYPDVEEVTIDWEAVDSNFTWNGSNNNADLVCESNTSRTERRIEEHPDWKSLTEEEQKLLRSVYSTFTLISVTFRCTETIAKRNYRFTEEDIVGNVNTIEVPPYLKNAHAGNWMNMGRTVRWTKGENVEITETWQYDMYGWGGTVTPSSNLKDIIANL